MLKAVLPVVLATDIQLIFFHNFFNISFIPALIVTLFSSSETIVLIKAIFESSNPWCFHPLNRIQQYLFFNSPDSSLSLPAPQSP